MYSGKFFGEEQSFKRIKFPEVGKGILLTLPTLEQSAFKNSRLF
jgi:hypothetical protein